LLRNTRVSLKTDEDRKSFDDAYTVVRTIYRYAEDHLFWVEHWLHTIWFKKVKDYPEGFTLYNGSVGTWRRVAISLGLPPETPVREIYRIYEERLGKPVDPIIVDSKKAPCKENIVLGDQVDLYRFPAPMVHEGDGGRYLCTWHFVVARDPDTGAVNWGMYRHMLHDKKSLAYWRLRPNTLLQ
jgi:4-hydroxy-3-polyprenylbenzoate decarboxylase